jgi:hypothetical protein
VVRKFLQKDQFFFKTIDSFKESDRTYSFDMLTLFALTCDFFCSKFRLVLSFFSIRATYSYLFLLSFGLCLLSLHLFPIFSLLVCCICVLPCYRRKIDSFKSQVDAQIQKDVCE